MGATATDFGAPFYDANVLPLLSSLHRCPFATGASPNDTNFARFHIFDSARYGGSQFRIGFRYVTQIFGEPRLDVEHVLPLSQIEQHAFGIRVDGNLLQQSSHS